MSIPYFFNLSLAKSLRSVSGKQAAKISLYVDFVRSFGGLYFFVSMESLEKFAHSQGHEDGRRGEYCFVSFLLANMGHKATQVVFLR